MMYIALMNIVLMMVTCLMSELFRTAGVFLLFVVDSVDVQIVLALFQNETRCLFLEQYL